MKYVRLTHIITILIIFILRLFFPDITTNLTHNINLFSHSPFTNNEVRSSIFSIFGPLLFLNYLLTGENKIFKLLYCILILLNISVIILFIHKFQATKKPASKSWLLFNLNQDYSHSIVAGGLLEMSYATLLIPLTSLIILLETVSKNS